MSLLSIDEGAGGAGSGAYACGLLTLANGETRGVETIAKLAVRAGEQAAVQGFPSFLASLRSALPAAGRLSMPARLAVSSVRAGLGVIEEGLTPESATPAPVEIGFIDGTALVARLSPDLLALIRRDRDIALAALARNDRAAPAAPQPAVEDGTTEALTSIFRYEKRNGRLRRVAEPDPSAND